MADELIQEVEEVTETQEQEIVVTEPIQQEQVKVVDEKETRRNILKSFGIKDESEINKMREVYNNSLSDTEKVINENESLKLINQELSKQVTELNELVTILKLRNNVELSEVETTLKMARGLVSETTNIEDALKIVLEKTKGVELKGKPLEQQSERGVENNINPFDSKNLDLQRCNELFLKYPQKAKQLAKKAGFPL